MVIGQVAEELAVSQSQSHLTADEGEPLTRFEQELADVIRQAAFEIALQPRLGGAEEVEQVRVPGGLPRQVGVLGRERVSKLMMAFPKRSCSRVSI